MSKGGSRVRQWAGGDSRLPPESRGPSEAWDSLTKRQGIISKKKAKDVQKWQEARGTWLPEEAARCVSHRQVLYIAALISVTTERVKSCQLTKHAASMLIEEAKGIPVRHRAAIADKLMQSASLQSAQDRGAADAAKRSTE